MTFEEWWAGPDKMTGSGRELARRAWNAGIEEMRKEAKDTISACNKAGSRTYPHDLDRICLPEDR